MRCCTAGIAFTKILIMYTFVQWSLIENGNIIESSDWPDLLIAGSSSMVFGVAFCNDETVVAIAGTIEVLANGLSLPLLCLTAFLGIGSLATLSVDTFDNGYETSSFLTTWCTSIKKHQVCSKTCLSNTNVTTGTKSLRAWTFCRIASHGQGILT